MMSERDLKERTYLLELSITELLGLVHPVATPFLPLARYQAVQRDLAPRLSTKIVYADLEAAITSVEIPILEAFRVADRFEGTPLPEGVYSLTLSFTFRSAEGTLTDPQVTEAVRLIRDSIASKCGAEFAG